MLWHFSLLCLSSSSFFFFFGWHAPSVFAEVTHIFQNPTQMLPISRNLPDRSLKLIYLPIAPYSFKSYYKRSKSGSYDKHVFMHAYLATCALVHLSGRKKETKQRRDHREGQEKRGGWTPSGPLPVHLRVLRKGAEQCFPPLANPPASTTQLLLIALLQASLTGRPSRLPSAPSPSFSSPVPPSYMPSNWTKS